MEFRNLKEQFKVLKSDMERSITEVCEDANFISGKQVKELEQRLADYVGISHCITCANGTDALSLVLMAWGIGNGDAVFVPDFTFFATAETPAQRGAVPIYVDVDENTFNIDCDKLEKAIIKVIADGKLKPRAIIPVDLFGMPADYEKINTIAQKYNLKVLEDGAQGFGGAQNKKRVGSLAQDAATTSFFPAKPLGCYGDGGAVFTNDDDMAALILSYAVHGRGTDKYDNIRLGLNSRLDTIQAAVLGVKLTAFQQYELDAVNDAAERYTDMLKDTVKTPTVPKGFSSSWAQYTITLQSESERNDLQAVLKTRGIPTMIYYPKTMSDQNALRDYKEFQVMDCTFARKLCKTVLSLPIHPYITQEEQNEVVSAIKEYFGK
ncbi:MAG: DegT/DnrJ/EryC1/StrS family aminotransferase [Oscillospiraceae bacterium]